jgi:hypothetical protein
MHCNRNPRRIRPALLVDEGDPKPNSGIVATSPKDNAVWAGNPVAFCDKEGLR